MKKRIGIIGATGSIGQQAADVVMQNSELFDVVFISAHSSAEALQKTAAKLNAKHSILMSDRNSAKKLDSMLDNEKLDMVLHAASGVDAAKSVYDVVSRGLDLALANKESIVTAGAIIMETAEKTGAKIIPVDSEHSAIFQCLKNEKKKYVKKITLTSSGGPFRERLKCDMGKITVAEALNHPRWKMGKKITVDSATMMNKGLELIEARYLFCINPQLLDVIVHPESVIHSFVTFSDNSIIAQMGCPDMKIPISYALGYPERISSGSAELDLVSLGSLKFERADLEKFGCLKLAFEVLKSDSNAKMVALNAANEAATLAFLEGKILFNEIYEIVEKTVDKIDFKDARCIDEAIENSKLASNIAAGFIH